MATNGGSARDAATARRRRIAERGAERLALITGRAQSVSSSPPPPSVALSHQPSTAPCPPSVSPISDELILSDENNDAPLKTEAARGDVASDIQPLNHNSETVTETSTQASLEPNKAQLFPATLTEHDPPTSTSNNSQKPKSQTRHRTFSPNQLRPSITASEDIRIICSLITGLLVLFSDAGFPILGSDIIKKIILFRPLFLLIATNITIIAAHFLLKKVEHREHRGSSTGELGFANHIGMVLEWGLLMKSGLSALFMDCSVYSVVVICGMGFLRLLGW